MLLKNPKEEKGFGNKVIIQNKEYIGFPWIKKTILEIL